MKKRIEARIIMVLLFCLALMTNVSTSSYSSIGVKNGDWIKYSLQESFSSTGERWQKIEFLSVEGATVTVRLTVQTSSGTEIDQTETIDLAFSDSDFSTVFFSMRVHIIPANLTTGDPVHLSSEFGNKTIIGEATMACAGADRRVVYSNFSQSGSQYTFCWDKQTGVLVEGAMVFGGAFKALWVTETNMWAGGGVAWWIWVIIAIAAICGIIASRKNISQKFRKKADASPHSKQ
ncbi:MAG TPA: hypothetical protein VIH48_05475 [Candidatus Bathyarchaeia archaeon]